MVIYQSKFLLEDSVTRNELLPFLFQALTGTDPPKEFQDFKSPASYGQADRENGWFLEAYGTDTEFAMRYEFSSGDGILRDVLTFVLEFAERISMAVSWDRFFEQYGGWECAMASVIQVPRVIRQCYSKGWISDPYSVFDLHLSVELLSQLLSGQDLLDRPLVYASCYTSDADYGSYGVDLHKLAWKLRGMAYVIAEPSPELHAELQEQLAVDLPTDGDLFLTYPGGDEPTVLSLDTCKGSVLDEIMAWLMQVSRGMTVFSSVTFEDVMKEVLHSMYVNLEQQSQMSVSDITDRDVEIARLKSELSAKETLVHTLQDRLDQQGKKLDVTNVGFVCKESDLYPGEVKDVLLKALSDAFHRIPDSQAGKCRKYHVLSDILESNGQTGTDTKIREWFTQAVKSGTISEKALRDAGTYGFTHKKTSKHVHWTFAGDNRYSFVSSSSPSDRRSGANLAASYMNLLFGY